MTQQQISTPSVLHIDDSVILSSAGYPSLGLTIRDPWHEVLLALETRSLDPATVVAGMDAANSPSASNPFITRSYVDLKLGNRGFILIGPIGSDADFEGTTDVTFTSAIASLPPTGGVVAVLAGTYTFNSTVDLPEGVCVMGIHPLSVLIQGTGNFSTFNLVGDESRLEFLSIENSNAATSPVITLTGIKASITGCHVYNYPLLGVRMVGSKSCVTSCLIDSDSSGIWLQGLYQTVEKCSFTGTLADGALRFENSMCSVLSNFISPTVVGASFNIPSPSCVNNKIVANHLGQPLAIASSLDNGTGSMRYANTPDTPVTNENNFLVALQSYTGQPLLTSTEMVLSNHFAHDTAVDKDATSIWSSLDIITQRIYEERNWILTSADPTFDAVGVPLTGIFSWISSSLTWPDFAVSSLVPNNTWTVSAGSQVLMAGEAVVLDIPRSASGVITPSVLPLSLLLENPLDANRYVLAYSPASGVLVWTKGFRLLTEMTSFDIDGLPLPINRFIGIPTDPRNTPAMPDSFAIGDDITEKLSSQSSLLKSLYEKSNLWENADGNSGVDMTPIVGEWADLTMNAPSTDQPTHILQVKGTTYALWPNFGVYRWYRVTPADGAGSWGALAAIPSPAPYASLSYVGTNLAVLTCSGSILIWDVDYLMWSSVTPTTSLSLPLPNLRPAGYIAQGQCDYAVQTPYYTIFTLLDGRTLLYFKTLNYLVESHRVFTETPKGTSFLGGNLKDTGFNVARNHWIDTVDNGAGSTLQGLPLSIISSPAPEIPPECYSDALKLVQWDKLAHESFSCDPDSGAFLCVAYSGSTYYVLGGGHGGSKLLSVVTIGTSTAFTDFTPHGWLTNAGNGEVVCFGTTLSTARFTVIRGQALSGAFGSPSFSWTPSVLGINNSSSGAVGVIDRYDNKGSGDIHILVSDPSRSNRPTWWQRNGLSWTSTTLSEAGGGGTAIVPAAVANSFTYNASTDRMAGYAVASSSIRFLVRDAARGNRPTLYSFDRTTFSSIRLSEAPLVAPADVAVAGADVSSITQLYGGAYQKAWDANIWISRDSTGNQVRVFFYFASTNTWAVHSVGTGGTYLNGTALGTPPFSKRTGSTVAVPTLTDFTDIPTTKDIFIWSNIGIIRGNITGYLTGITSATWTQFDKRQPSVFPIFSSTPMTTYSPTLGSSRNDLSIQMGSMAEKTLPVFGSGLSDTVGGLYWFDLGTKVKQVSSTVWVGLNRGGYLWIGNPAFSKMPQELTPNTTTVRGDITIANLGFSDDFDWAWDSTQTQLAIVYRDFANASPAFPRLGFIQYNSGTNAITHERGAQSGVVPITSTPQITYNNTNTTWTIVAQDTTTPARMMLFRRNVAGGWLPDETALPGEGKSPAKPMHHTDGSILTVTELGTFNAQVSMRVHATNLWTPIYQTTGGGFVAPRFTRSLDGTKWWIFGSQGGRVAWASDPTSMASWLIWSGSPCYARVTTPVLLAQTSSVIVATSASIDGTTPASREMLVWRFENTGTVTCIGAFTSKGRLQTTAWSGEEEDGITDISWTPDAKILYGATRPSRTSLHWSLRGSRVGWASPHGESLLGSGRYITLGEKHFREQWGSTTSSGIDQNLIIEYPNIVGWSSLPLAQRTSDLDYLGLKWPFAASTGRLFTSGSPSVDDTTLPSGALVSSATRLWPLIFGSTRWGGLHQTGPSVFSQGGMLSLLPPPTMTNTTYFGTAALGSNNLFKIKALAAVTFKGTRVWKDNVSRQYTLVGPITYQIDVTLPARGSHLVLEFNTASSLNLDATENPLSYWSELNHSNTNYAVVIGEVREQEFLLYPALGMRTATPLTYGNLEPIEMASEIKDWIYTLPYKLDLAPWYEILPTGSTSFALKRVGSLKGIQSLTFIPAVQKQLALRRLLPLGGWFIYQSPAVIATSSRVQALASITDSIVIFDKLSGDLP